MNISIQIDQDLKSSLKEKKDLEVSVLRMTKSAIHNAEIEKRSALSDEEISAVLQKEVKKRQEAVELYKKGNRPELAAKEQKEIEILKKYLPKEIPPEEIEKAVKEAIDKTDAKGPQDLGKVMGQVMPQLKGKATGTEVSEIARRLLS